MSIHRTYKGDANTPPDYPFTRIDNRIFDDTQLSLDAMGVLVYLLSKPDDWTIRDKHLKNHFSIGRKRLDRIMGELKTCGYLKRWQYRGKNGRFATKSQIYEHPTIADAPSRGSNKPTDVPLPNNGEPSADKLPSDEPPPVQGDSLPTMDSVTMDLKTNEIGTSERETALSLFESNNYFTDFFQNEYQISLYPAQVKKIEQIVTDIDVFKSILHKWIMNGHKPQNIQGILDWYNDAQNNDDFGTTAMMRGDEVRLQTNPNASQQEKRWYTDEERDAFFKR